MVNFFSILWGKYGGFPQVFHGHRTIFTVSRPICKQVGNAFMRAGFGMDKSIPYIEKASPIREAFYEILFHQPLTVKASLFLTTVVVPLAALKDRVAVYAPGSSSTSRKSSPKSNGS